jgi:hypothetical protein
LELPGVYDAAVLKLPVGHAMHVPPSSPEYPALHLQSVCSLLPSRDCDEARHESHTLSVFAIVVEYLSTGQLSHVAGPTVVLYVPAPHAAHVVPSLPVYPLLHLQSMASLLPGLDCMFVAHPKHVVIDTAAPSVEYLSATQFVHDAGPVASLNVPAKHAVHV